MMRRILLAVIAGCLVLTASASLAEEKGQPVTDEKFVFKASQDGKAEVAHGKLAAERAGSADVKKFAERMVKDHGKANKDLAALAKGKGLKLAKDMGKKHKEMQDKLGGMSGADFDRHYMHHMVEGHQKAVALFKAEAKNGKDEGLRGFAEKTLPTLEDHLRMARQIHGKVKGGSSEK